MQDLGGGGGEALDLSRARIVDEGRGRALGGLEFPIELGPVFVLEQGDERRSRPRCPDVRQKANRPTAQGPIRDAQRADQALHMSIELPVAQVSRVPAWSPIQAAEEAVRSIGRVCETEKIQADLQPNGLLTISNTALQDTILREEVETAERLGLSGIGFLQKEEIRSAIPQGRNVTMRVVAYDEMRPFLLRATAEGIAPDVAMIDHVWVAEFARMHMIHSLHALDAPWADATLQTDIHPAVSEAVRSFMNRITRRIVAQVGGSVGPPRAR